MDDVYQYNICIGIFTQSKLLMWTKQLSLETHFFKIFQNFDKVTNIHFTNS